MTDTYDRRTIVYHWASAALVLGLWIAGQCIDFFPKGTPRITVRSLLMDNWLERALVTES